MPALRNCSAPDANPLDAARRRRSTNQQLPISDALAALRERENSCFLRRLTLSFIGLTNKASKFGAFITPRRIGTNDCCRHQLLHHFPCSRIAPASLLLTTASNPFDIFSNHRLLDSGEILRM